MSEYKVGDVARISNVSVRTFHHYDEIGLLVPSGRSEAGYRLYAAGDLARLRQILFYRALGFGLEQIAEILADTHLGAEEHLRRQHRLLRERLAQTQLLITAIEHEMEGRRMGISLTPEEQLEVFGTGPLAEYEAEAERRWGARDTWAESRRRTAGYGQEDWIEIKRQADQNVASLAAAMNAGRGAASDAAMDLAEAHRLHISRWLYECPPDHHRALAELYVSDRRFEQTYERVAPGLARYVHDAIVANAARSRG